MSYFNSRARQEAHWDHARDLAKHSWPPAEVSSQPDPDHPGLSAHVITGWCAQDVQAEINKFMAAFADKPGEGHFTHPVRVGARYTASGYTWFGRVS